MIKLWRIMLLPIFLVLWTLMMINFVIYLLLCVLTLNIDRCVIAYNFASINPIRCIKDWLEYGVQL